MSQAHIYETVIKAQKGWLDLELRDVWNYRYMAYFMILRSLRASYQQTILGPLWILINSFVGVIVYSVFFGVVADLPSNGIPYPIFVFVAMLPWGIFSTITSNVAVSMNNGMIKKVYFPRLIIPVISVGNYMVNFFLSLLLLVFFMIFYQVAPTWKLISLPFFTLVSLLAAVGLGLLFAPFEVRSRDTRHILGYIMRFWFYGTPVVYALEALPDSLRPLAQLNPMTSIIEAYRWAVLGTEAPSPYGLLYATVFAFVIFYVGLVVFKQQENSFADLI